MGLSSWRGGIAPVSLLAAASVALAGLIMTPVGSPAGATEPGAVVMTAVGDIDGCGKGADTAELVAKTTGPIATVGDHGYPEGTSEAFSRCYDPTWGRFKDRTHPVPGNHDYEVSKAAPYYEYFGAAAGEPGRGWYSYDVGSWHVVALNSNCYDVDCDEQSRWLETDLKAHPSPCTLAYWHHPRFSSGTSGGDGAVGAFWEVLYDHGATVVLSGHDHDYERFAPQDPSGRRDPDGGIRQFIVGTGGGSLGSFAGTAPNSEIRHNDGHGVLELTLRSGGYAWRFVSVAGDTFTDSGSGTCRGTAPAPAAPPSVGPAAPPPKAETPERPAGPPATTDSPPAPGSGSPGPGSADPPATRRRPPTPTAPPAAPQPPRGGTPARSGPPPEAVRPASSRPAASATLPTTPPAVTLPPPADPHPGGASDTPAGDSIPPPNVLTGTIPAWSTPAEAASAVPDTTTLALSISGLLDDDAPPSHPAERRGVTVVAILLMAVDSAAIAALYRRGRGAFRG